MTWLNKKIRDAEEQNTSPARCAWQSGSGQCCFFGSISQSAMGAGPYYCSAHFRCVQTADAVHGDRIVEESIKTGYHDWSDATRMNSVMAAYEARRKLPKVAMAVARKFGSGLVLDRVPGSDDEDGH